MPKTPSRTRTTVVGQNRFASDRAREAAKRDEQKTTKAAEDARRKVADARKGRW
ncbi:hypothetical protein [Glycomyces albidus]|uniref:hypothetical protein n=1 Tax=Glycomyces albidus TaxID=2656774 RepID=UPI00129036A3|nr:hypothetical protein [Glycomyces albidus]